jgi:hypothetical protein
MSGGLFTAALLRETGRPGAYRFYQDPRDLLEHLDEPGVRSLK